MIRVTVNRRPVSFDGPDDTPLLWVLRDHLKLTGAKYGCGIGRCGACTVHVGGEATTACTLRVGAPDGAEVLTIEGLAGDEPLHSADRGSGACRAAEGVDRLLELERDREDGLRCPGIRQAAAEVGQSLLDTE